MWGALGPRGRQKGKPFPSFLQAPSAHLELILREGSRGEGDRGTDGKLEGETQQREGETGLEGK